jgi:hypothetical protein
MKALRFAFMALSAGVLCTQIAPNVQAQVSINVQVGAAPVCPYGYFNYAPYSCAPVGYYGPEWFAGGVFLGAGPWFHGPVGFHGYVDHAYDPRFGYRGPFPARGERADWGRHVGWEKHFHRSEFREEHIQHDNGHHYGEYKHADDDHGHGHDHDDDHGHDHGR